MAMVLVADDSLSVRKVTERLLTQAGMEVFSVESGAEAMRWMNARRPDLIIADVIMMDMSGYEICSYIRSHATLRDTPVLLISGVVDEEVMRNADDCRANGVIKKPFFGSALPDRVLELLATAKHAPPVSSQTAPVASKVYRISEGQLQSVRDAMSLIKELEDGLVAERKLTAQLEAEISVLRATSGESGLRISDLEARLVEAEAQFRQWGTHVTQIGNTGEGLKDLEARIEAWEGRSQHVADQLPALQEALGRVAELERRLAETEKRARVFEEQAQTFYEKIGGSGERVAGMEARFEETEEWFRQIGEQVRGIGEAGERVKYVEARLAAEEGRVQWLSDQMPIIQQAVVRFPEFESRQSKEERLAKELREQVQGVRDAGVKVGGCITDLEHRVTEDATRVQKIEDQVHALEGTMEKRAEQEAQRATHMLERVAALEPAAASMRRLVRALADPAQPASSPGDGGP